MKTKSIEFKDVCAFSGDCPNQIHKSMPVCCGSRIVMSTIGYAALLIYSLTTTLLAASGNPEKDDATVAFFKMKYEGETGTVIDSTKHYALKLGNDLKKPTQIVGRDGGMAMAFGSNSGGFVDHSQNITDFIPDNGVKVEAWIRPKATDRPLSMIVECFGYLQTGWRFAIANNRRLTFLVETNEKEMGVVATSDELFDGNWHLVAAEYDPATGHATLKVDGIVIGENALEGVPWSKKPGLTFNVGFGLGGGAAGWYFDGDIDSVRISQRAGK